MMRAIILDRDGVINEDSDAYIKSLDEWRPIPGSIDAIARLAQAGWTIAVCTNQSGIARGLISEATVSAIHDRLRERVRQAGGEIHGIFVCPHGPDADCDCRKPRAGLLLEAARRLGFSLADIPIVGDSERDLQAGALVGGRLMLVRTGKGERTLARGLTLAVDGIYEDLAAVVDALLNSKPEHVK